jgi:hypothetical protein
MTNPLDEILRKPAITNAINNAWDELLRKRYESGHKWALMLCLRDCMELGRPIPEWARKAFCEAYDKIHRYEIESYDDAFGRHRKKGEQLVRARHKAKIRIPLVLEIVRRRRAGAAMFKEKLFHEVGKQFGVGATVAAEIYYDIPEWILEKIEAIIDDETSGKI